MIKKIFTSLIFRDKFFKFFLGASLALNFIIWVLLWLKFYPLRGASELLPLHYNIYFGVDFVGQWHQVFIMPAVGIFFIAINSFLADIIYLRDKVVSYFLLGTSAFVQVLLGLAAYMIIAINQ